MNKLVIALLLATSLYAQQQAALDPANPMSSWVRNAYTGNRNNIIRTAEKMPEENYGMRPGAQPEVRTFGQHLMHAATFNYLWCSQAKGEKNPNPGNLDKLTSKAEILKTLNDAFAYCDAVYSSLTDAKGTEMIDITQENGRQTRNMRLGLLTLNYAHNNEIYGSLVVYLRIKNLVPPASEPRPPQAQK